MKCFYQNIWRALAAIASFMELPFLEFPKTIHNSSNIMSWRGLNKIALEPQR